MKIMGRVVFQNMKGAEAAEERLRAAGYEIEFCWDVIDVYSSAVFMEIFKDFPVDADEVDADGEWEWEVVSGVVIDEVNEIVDPYHGDCSEAGPVPDDYVPHSEDEAELGAIF
jgi:hypothetical protein